MKMEPNTQTLFHNGDFLPIKSDGSLFLTEPLSTSPTQGVLLSSDVIGATDATILSLDSNFFFNHYYNYHTGLDTIHQKPSFQNEEIPCLKTWTDNNDKQHQDDLQRLSLSMSPGSQSSCVTVAIEPKKRKSIDKFGQRTSQYRGVTRHRWTGRYEAHLWDNSCKKEGQTRKGRQVYLGGYDKEEKAARAYDLAALKYWGPSTHINFELGNYHQELEEMKDMSRQEYVAHLRRRSSGFSRGASIYRGVTRHHQHGRWQARIGRVAGNKDLYLGTFSTQEQAAEAYDIAAIKFRGVNAVTNFIISRYDVDKILASSNLPTGDVARRPSKEKKPSMYMTDPVAVEHINDLIGIEMSQTVVDEFSNATSLSSSREGSPEKYGVPVLFAQPTTTTNTTLANMCTNMNTWIPAAAQLRPVPVFTKWGDA